MSPARRDDGGRFQWGGVTLSAESMKPSTTVSASARHDRGRDGVGAGPLRIALVSPPMVPVPPPRYAGTERVVAVLARELQRRGHVVTLFAPGDSDPGCELVETIPRSLWAEGYRDDISAFVSITLARIAAHQDRFDIIHSHVESLGLLFARLSAVPVVSTLHGRLDQLGMPELLSEFRDVPLVAISDSQRRWSPEANWVATVHHGLPLAEAPFGREPGQYLAFVGRIAPEKGVAEAIDLARSTGVRLRMAAKVFDDQERDLFDRLVAPAVDEGVVDYIGEVGARERDSLFAGALATVMLGAWPEPFGLVAIESLGCGTPLIARRAGALPEIVTHHQDGFIVDDLSEARLAVELAGTLDRASIRRRAIGRFSVERMTDGYERVYRALLEPPGMSAGDAVAQSVRLPDADAEVAPAASGLRLGRHSRTAWYGAGVTGERLPAGNGAAPVRARADVHQASAERIGRE
jgi:glycosyltransferase involved in cell wall biosynthesis